MAPDFLDDSTFRLLVDHLPGGIMVEAGQKIVYLNPAARILLGAGPEDLTGTPVLGRFPEDARPRNLDRLQAMAAQPGPIAPAEEVLLRVDGSAVVVEISAIPFPLKGTTGALFSLKDLTEERNFQTIIDRLPAGVFIQTRGRFALANQEARRILGARSSEDIVGTPVLDRVPPEFHPVIEERIRTLAQGQSPAGPVEHEFLRLDGQAISVKISSVPLQFHGESGALVFIRDTSEDRNFRTIIDQLPAGVFVQTEGRFAVVNQDLVRILGARSAQELLGTPVIERFVERERGQILQRIARLNQDREPVEAAQETMLRDDGSEVPVEVSAVPFRHEGSEGALVFLRDLTKEKEAEAKIRVQDELLRLTGSMAQVGGWEFDTATGEGSWTDEVAWIHDLDPSVPTDMSFGLGFYEPESRARLESAIQTAIDQAIPFDLVVQMVSAMGRRKWVRTQGTPVVSEGKVVRMKGIFQDVTASYLAAQAVLQEKERLQVTLRSIGDGVITTDTEGRVVLMSRSAEDLTGWPQAEAQGRPLDEVLPLVHEWTRRPMENPVAWVLKEGKTTEMASHTVLLSRDGRERLIADSAAPILDVAGTVTGVVVVFRDMTEKQKLAEAVQRAQNLESIGLLAAGIAHDFNNLLSGLFGQIQLAQDKVRRGKVQEAEVNFDRALGVFDRARDLTGQLLTFSKGGAPVRVPLDLAPLVRRTAQFALAGSNVDARFDFDPGLGSLWGDPNQLAQAVENLVINARQAMPSGGTIEITTQEVELADGRYAVIGIEDHGPGIPPETLSKIFDPFYTTKTGGHGLGLAAVLSIVQRHEGRVEVTSPPGQGAKFQIWLPAG